MSVKIYTDYSTEQLEVNMIPLPVDLGRRLHSSKRETFCPHVWCRQQRCHHRRSQRSNRRHDPISQAWHVKCVTPYPNDSKCMYIYVYNSRVFIYALCGTHDDWVDEYTIEEVTKASLTTCDKWSSFKTRYWPEKSKVDLVLDNVEPNAAFQPQ